MDRKRKLFAALRTILPLKFFNPKGIAMRLMFGVLVLSFILWLTEDHHLNQKMSKIHIKKSNNALLAFPILFKLRFILNN